LDSLNKDGWIIDSRHSHAGAPLYALCVVFGVDVSSITLKVIFSKEQHTTKSNQEKSKI